MNAARRARDHADSESQTTRKPRANNARPEPAPREHTKPKPRATGYFDSIPRNSCDTWPC
jgi:hypothetical protein